MTSPYIYEPSIREGQTINEYRCERPGKRSWRRRIRHALAWLNYQTRRSNA